MVSFFQRDHSQSTHRLGSLIELCTCGAEFKDHESSGRCPPRVRVFTTDSTTRRCVLCDRPHSGPHQTCDECIEQGKLQ